jgi:hypothetical protein
MRQPLLQIRGSSKTTKSWSFNVRNNLAKIALALLLVTPAASMARTAGGAGAGNVPISGIPPGPANAGGLNNVTVDPSGIGNAAKMAPLPPPSLAVPVVPQFK